MHPTSIALCVKGVKNTVMERELTLRGKHTKYVDFDWNCFDSIYQTEEQYILILSVSIHGHGFI